MQLRNKLYSRNLVISTHKPLVEEWKSKSDEMIDLWLMKLIIQICIKAEIIMINSIEFVVFSTRPESAFIPSPLLILVTILVRLF